MKKRHKKQAPLTAALPIYKLFPSIMTIIGICFGLFSLKSAISGKFEMAVILLVFAGVIDALDGKVARLLNATSPFGEQIDSLADFLNFGVVPALVVYFWQISEVKAWGWAVVLFYIICQAIRLARFNSRIDAEPEIPELKYKFFEGVAAPMGAALVFLPIMLSFLFKKQSASAQFEIDSIYVIIYMAFIGLLMVSKIPTFSFKGLKINREYISFVLALFGLVVISAVTVPWVTFPLIDIFYFLSIPWCYYRSYQIKAKYKQQLKKD